MVCAAHASKPPEPLGARNAALLVSAYHHTTQPSCFRTSFYFLPHFAGTPFASDTAVSLLQHVPASSAGRAFGLASCRASSPWHWGSSCAFEDRPYAEERATTWNSKTSLLKSTHRS